MFHQIRRQIISPDIERLQDARFEALIASTQSRHFLQVRREPQDTTPKPLVRTKLFDHQQECGRATDKGLQITAGKFSGPGDKARDAVGSSYRDP